MTTMPSGISTPDSESLAHSSALSKRIIDEINVSALKAIPFARFMELALYEKGLGYYVAGKSIIGKQADFVTAPEISPLFACCLANQLDQIFSMSDLSPTVLEFGAGTGKLAAHLLTALHQKNRLPERYFILEPSPSLCQLQKHTLATHCPRLVEKVTWISRLPDKPYSGIIIANEVIDAMPVHLIQYDNGMLLEYHVRHHQGVFEWQLEKASCSRLSDYWKKLKLNLTLPEPYTTEINLYIKPWLRSISDFFSKGLILLIDYGFPRYEYYHPSRQQGTLMCHYQQQAHTNPLIWPGLQDITAHVDFTEISLTAAELSLSVSGFTHQGAFLLNCGLLDELQALQQQHDALSYHVSLNQQVNLLTAPHEMGELFKVMALTRDIKMPLLGFQRYDQRHRLKD